MATNNLDTLIDREITVLMGGWSAEREISLKTGKAVTNSIRSLGCLLYTSPSPRDRG